VRYTLIAIVLLVTPLVATLGADAAVRVITPPKPKSADQTAPAEKSDSPKPKADAASLPWITGLNEGITRALADKRPIFALVEGPSCSWCRKLEKELAKPEVQKELARWTRLTIDVDRAAEDAAQLGVGPIPALRVLTSTGQLVASHDGYLPADELVGWLRNGFTAVTAAPDEALLGSDAPDWITVLRIIDQFGQRNPAVREAAIRRLLPYPDVARPAVVKAFLQGSLATRLTALELLSAWRAPVEGLDPWRPETLTSHKAALDQWAAQAARPAEMPKELSTQQTADVRREIQRMLQAQPTEVEGIRERLARLGPLLLPEVYAQLKHVASDQDRQRLLSLRYRLVAGDALVLGWPGGIVRLAAADSRERQKAVEELAARASADDQRLLLELFSDSDPLVREISLRGLRHIGGRQALSALTSLLSDPDANVRAAVLKQLAEKPSPEMVPQVVAYVAKETDADLVVHAIRFLRVTQSPGSVRCLMSLLSHPQWQVRAEAAESLGKLEGRGGDSTLQADVYVALIGVLDDTDAFVVSRALTGLSRVDLEEAVDPLVRAAGRHPALLPGIVEILGQGANLRRKALPHLRGFAKNKDPAVRAAAVVGLFQVGSDQLDKEVAAAIVDPQSKVRIATATAMFNHLNTLRSEHQQKLRSARESVTFTPSSSSGDVTFTYVENETITIRRSESSSPMLTSLVRALLGSEGATQPAKVAEKTPPAAAPEKPSAVEKPVVKQAAPKEPAVEKSPAVPADEAKGKEKKEPKDDPDQWLTEFYAGRGRPDWTAAIAPLAEPMLKASSPEERIAAALLLVPLGRAEQALPVLLETVRAEPTHAGQVHEVLPWLVWNRRLELFRQLWARADKDRGNRYWLIQSMGETSDRRAADVFWGLLAEDKTIDENTGLLEQGLRTAYTGERWSWPNQMSVKLRSELAVLVKPHALAGSEPERLVAMVMLCHLDREDTTQIARRAADDPKLSESLRYDAFKLLLLSQSTPERLKSAKATLSTADRRRRKLALGYLVDGSSTLRNIEHINVWMSESDEAPFGGSYRGSPGGQAQGAKREGPSPEQLQPLLADSDPLVAAYAGYLLAMQGRAEGLATLLRYWSKTSDRPPGQVAAAGDDERDVGPLVTRAIAALDDANQLPVLRKIYGRYLQPAADDDDGPSSSGVNQGLKDFYWTIRTMSGAEILKFRKEIRDKVGMKNLQ
jgi:HEAT repeat protein